MIRDVRRVVAVLLTAVTLGACVGGGGSSSTPTDPSGAAGSPSAAAGAVSDEFGVGQLNTPLPPTAGATTTTIVRTAYQLGLDTPEAAAKNLWDAWRDDDRPRALIAADEQAVTTLFEDRWGPEMDEQGCTPVVVEVRYRCAFVQGNSARLIDVGLVAGRYRVTGVERIGDLATSSGPKVGNRPGPVGGPTTVPITRAPRPRPRPTSASNATDGTDPASTGADTAADSPTSPSTRQRPRTTPPPERIVESNPGTEASITPIPVQARAPETSVG